MTTLNTVYSSFYNNHGRYMVNYKMSLMGLQRDLAKINKCYNGTQVEFLENRINTFAINFLAGISDEIKESDIMGCIVVLFKQITQPSDEIRKLKKEIFHKIASPRLVFPAASEMPNIEVYGYAENFFKLVDEVKKDGEVLEDQEVKTDLKHCKKVLEEFLQGKITYDRDSKICRISQVQCELLKEKDFWRLIDALKTNGSMEHLYINSHDTIIVYPIAVLENLHRLHQESPQLFKKDDLFQKVVVKFSDDIQETEIKAALCMTRFFVDFYKAGFDEAKENFIDLSSKINEIESIIEFSEEEQMEPKEDISNNPEIYNLGFKVYMNKIMERNDDFEYFHLVEEWEVEIQKYPDLKDVVTDLQKLSTWHEDFAIELFKRLIHENEGEIEEAEEIEDSESNQ